MPCMTCSFDWLMPVATAVSSDAMVTKVVSGTLVASAAPQAHNSSSRAGYTFPTLRMRHDEAANATMTVTATSSHTGGAGGICASVAVVLAGVVAGVWFA
jgi:hypothetical protein